MLIFFKLLFFFFQGGQAAGENAQEIRWKAVVFEIVEEKVLPKSQRRQGNVPLEQLTKISEKAVPRATIEMITINTF